MDLAWTANAHELVRLLLALVEDADAHPATSQEGGGHQASGPGAHDHDIGWLVLCHAESWLANHSWKVGKPP